LKNRLSLFFSLIIGLLLFGGTTSAQQIQSMKLLTPQTGWAQSGQHLYWTTDDGAHWKVIDPHLSSKFNITYVFFLNANMGWALLSGGFRPWPRAWHPSMAAERFFLWMRSTGG
jgi:hypothetical protein